MEKTGNNEQVKGNSCGPDVCRCQCLIGGACNRPVCTGAYKLERVCPEDGGVCDFCDGVLEEQCEDAREPLPPCPFCGSKNLSVEDDCEGGLQVSCNREGCGDFIASG